jgi:predicted aconitase with swiveling domain
MAELIRGKVVVAGEATGDLLLSTQPLSFWGGYDSRTGEIIDRRHPLSGRIVKDCILALPDTIGSSTTTAVLLEAVRAGTAPAAIVTRGVDTFLALASIVSNEMYGRAIPIVALDLEQFRRLPSEARARVRLDGTIVIE